MFGDFNIDRFDLRIEVKLLFRDSFSLLLILIRRNAFFFSKYILNW